MRKEYRGKSKGQRGKRKDGGGESETGAFISSVSPEMSLTTFMPFDRANLAART